MIKLNLTFKDLIFITIRILKFCVFAALGAMCFAIAADVSNEYFARFGLEGTIFRIFKTVGFALLTGLFFNAILRQLPKKYQSRKYLF